MPMREHDGEILPAAELDHPDIELSLGEGVVTLETAGRVDLTEAQVRGLIIQLHSGRARVFGGFAG